MSKWRLDPRWITVRYAGKCAQCGSTVKAGARAYYWPADKSMYCEKCGQQASRDFAAAAWDEDR